MAAGDDSRERLLERARAACELPEPDRRNAILQIIKERYAQTLDAWLRGERPEIPCSIEDVIFCAYETTDRFWRGCLYDAWPHATVIALLAITAATSDADEQRRLRLLDLVLARYPGDVGTEPALVVARWLAEHPDTEGLLHSTLFAYLSATAAAAAERSDHSTKSEVEARPAEDLVAEPKPEATPADTRISSEAEAAWEYVTRLARERGRTGRAATRDADYDWARRVRPFHVTQALVNLWRSLLLTPEEKFGGAPPRTG
jgi:hypothetical protein